mmetsp:Transcript_122321/g.228560  ORF Transcript_122321/g.228560 Transcript_122321/m.228560 type:complete len:648 (+) Transcript_122321:69-2012(+)
MCAQVASACTKEGMLDSGAEAAATASAAASSSSAREGPAAIANSVDEEERVLDGLGSLLEDADVLPGSEDADARLVDADVVGVGSLPEDAEESGSWAPLEKRLKEAAEASEGSAGSSAPLPSPASDTILVRLELSETLREDGRLLRMFVRRGEHLKSEARQLAVRNWLIPGEFYDKWLEVFVKRYGLKYAEAADLQDRSSELADVCLGALRPKANVDALEAKLATSGKDVFQLRDLLLIAAKDLSAPRRHLGTHSNIVMPPEAIEALRRQRQVRLRAVVLACLRGIYASGEGGEVLRIASESAKSMIERFEDTQDEVCTARQGGQWHELKVLLDEIEGKSQTKAVADGTSGELDPPSTDAPDDAEKRKIKQTKKEGKGTKFLLEKALTDLGGEATTRDLINWVEAHQEFTEEHSSMRINKNLSAASPKNAEVPIWHRTLTSVLSCHFTGVRRNGKGFVWRSPNSVPALTDDADADDQALPALPPASAIDAAAEQASSAPIVRKARQRKRRQPVLLGADTGTVAEPAEGTTPQAALPAGRGKRKSAKGQKPSTAPANEDQTAAILAPDPLALLSALDGPETLANAPSQAEELIAELAQPPPRSTPAAEVAKEPPGGPPSKRARKANLDIDVDPLSLALDAAIAAASAS